MKHFLFLILAISLSGCASYFKKKQCESINWFEHGKQVALRGVWLNADATVVECRKVEADIQESQLDQGFKNGMQKYCSNTNAYTVGKSGDFFSRDLCDGPQINVLLAEHKKGVQDYCAKNNGQSAGASGKKYQNICPKDLESAFLVEYRKGRKKYVQAMIESKLSEVRDLDSKIGVARSDLDYTRGRLRSYETDLSFLESERNGVSLENTSHRSSLDARISSVNQDVMSLQSQASREQNNLSSLEEKRNSLSKEISDFKAELPGLD